MKIVVSVKCVPDDEGITVKSDRSLDLSEAQWHISQYDLNAIEAARQLKDSMEGAELEAVTAGGEIVTEGRRRKDILSRGISKLYCIKGEELQTASADAFYTASVLSDGIKRIGNVDLVIFGEGSGDLYSQQTGSLTGQLLGWSTINGVSKIEIKDDSTLIVERSLEDRTEKLEVRLPAALSVTADINTPRFPSVKDTLSAGKKPFEIWDVSEVSAPQHGSVTTTVSAPENVGRKCVVYQSADEEAIASVAAELKKYI